MCLLFCSTAEFEPDVPLASSAVITRSEVRVSLRCKQRITRVFEAHKEVMFTTPATSTLFPPLIGNVYHIRKRSRRDSSRGRGTGGGAVGLEHRLVVTLSRAPPQT